MEPYRLDFCLDWAANNFKEPWKSLWGFNFLGVIETCCSNRDFWFQRHLQTILQQISCKPTVF